MTRAESPISGAVPAEPFGYRLPKNARFVGHLSCASAACHGGNPAGGVKGSEHTVWADGDPHFRGRDVLTSATSRRMVGLLHGNRPGQPIPAHVDARCLACHAPEAAAHPAPSAVGCESCHGPAEHWLTTHYQADFKALSRREKAERFGLYPTKDLAFRVTLCASCHVGDAGREVDHDLIAAGHPRLAFEYTGYHHNPKYTRHWDETTYGPDFDARAWEIGQVACARSAAKLLAARATDANHPWPELAEYSCFACHHDLDAKYRWKEFNATERNPGALPWGTWYFTALDLAAGRSAELTALTDLMEHRPPDRPAVARAAEQLARRLDTRLAELQVAAESPARPYTPDEVARRFRTIAATTVTEDGRQLRNLDWDGVTQRYLGIAAHYYAWSSVDPAAPDRRLRPPLDRLGGELAFPKRYNSPDRTDPRRLLDLFRQLQPDGHP